ncbi:hypothetical protein [Micromonospora zhanjiangensis]
MSWPATRAGVSIGHDRAAETIAVICSAVTLRPVVASFRAVAIPQLMVAAIAARTASPATIVAAALRGSQPIRRVNRSRSPLNLRPTGLDEVLFTVPVPSGGNFVVWTDGGAVRFNVAGACRRFFGRVRVPRPGRGTVDVDVHPPGAGRS